ncbi:MAG: type I polyketide synthase, partial [Planctomycetota bacterium]
SLFREDLAGPCLAARRAWNLTEADPEVEWRVGVVRQSSAELRERLKGSPRVYLLIVNTPQESIIGGDARQVDALVEELGCEFFELQGVTTVHCDVVRQVAEPYRKLHLLDTSPPAGVRFYSAARGEAYAVDRDSAADSILEQALHGFDFPKVVEAAYRDGVRIFLEVGPGASCSRMISAILGERPHLARSACTPTADPTSQLLRLQARLLTERLGSEHARSTLEACSKRALTPVLLAAQSATAEAHEVYLRFVDGMRAALAERETLSSPPQVSVALHREACLEFAVGSVGRVLGPQYDQVDSFPTRVRLPAEPLMLVDRILEVEGEPRSLGPGRVVTEHEVHRGAWYLDSGRIPTCIAVEAGQADLFLCGYLGIDLHTRGLAMYRLLDADVTFHRELPGPGECIRYEIHIDEFFSQGSTTLFRFRFEGTVNGALLLSMKNGCAGFFTSHELTAGQGLVERKGPARPSVRPRDWPELVEIGVESYDAEQLEALRTGDLAAAFGSSFAELPLKRPLTLPGGLMKLVERVTELDPHGGRYGLGGIRAEMDVSPQAWYLTCHFVDDPVMPGTLMYECCLHTLRILLLRSGWVGEADTVVPQPVPGVTSRLKCRGQVIESTRTVTYEVSIRELGQNPELYVIADAIMYADGKPIVEIVDLSVRFSGMTLKSLVKLWKKPKRSSPVLYDRDQILAFAIGKPSEAFGERYRIFDEERFIARLPGPPYAFVDRITQVEGEPWKLAAGGVTEAEYDVDPEAWYWSANRQPTLPYAVLLEVGLQVCGWTSAYIGSALSSSGDLHYRNLGGSAVQSRHVTPLSGTLTTRLRVTDVSHWGGMLIQHFDLEIRDGAGSVLQGKTYFGFFSPEALAEQVGIRDAQPFSPDESELARGRCFPYPKGAPFPDTQMGMIDRVDTFVADGGPKSLGFLRGSTEVNPDAWFFKAHFRDDPVWPGSLGLEALLQLLKVAACEHWGTSPEIELSSMALGLEHHWTYRGQVLPSYSQVTVEASITDIDAARHTITADGWLAVDGRWIYQMRDFSLEWREPV